jgi:C4-dicarboxylate-specific signal transduction histidine kinase
VLPETGHCLFSRDRKSSAVSMIEYVAKEPPPTVFTEALAASVSELLMPQRVATGRIRYDWSEKFQEWFGGVIAAVIRLEANSSLVLVVWMKKPESFSNNDLELLSVYSLFARTILNDALLVKSLRKANRLLKANSSRLAEVESVAALADMTSGVAHQFNNIIGGVVGRVQLARLMIRRSSLPLTRSSRK